MDRHIKELDGAYRWSCSIDTDYHRRFGMKGLWGILFVCAAVFIVFIIASRGTDAGNDFWIPLLVTGVILVIGLPLIYLWNSASDPHEQYVMNEVYVKSGYGKASVYSEFKKIKEAVVTVKYIELIGKNGRSRVYVPAEDMDFVRDYILERLPEDAAVRRR